MNASVRVLVRPGHVLCKKVKLRQLECLIFSSKWIYQLGTLTHFKISQNGGIHLPKVQCEFCYDTVVVYFNLICLQRFELPSLNAVWQTLKKKGKMDWTCFVSATFCSNQIPQTQIALLPTLHLHRPWLIFQIYAACPAGFTAKEVSECTETGGLKINWDTSRCKARGVM